MPALDLPAWFPADAIFAALPESIAHRRWFGAKSRRIMDIEPLEALPIPGVERALLLLVRIVYTEGDATTYLLPVRLVDTTDDTDALLVDLPHPDGGHAILIDACHDVESMRGLLRVIADGAAVPGIRGTLRGIPTSCFTELRGDGDVEPLLSRLEGSNSAIMFGDRLILKLFRRPSRGTNPDWELGRYLTDAHFTHVPRTAGGIEYTEPDGTTRTLALLQELVANEGDARQAFRAQLRPFLAAAARGIDDDFRERRPDWSLVPTPAPETARRHFMPSLKAAALLGQRTAEMHLALAAATDPALAPIPCDEHYLRTLATAGDEQLERARERLQRGLPLLREADLANASRLLAMHPTSSAQAPVTSAPAAIRIRVHGDYHLEQVITCNDDFVILDFEGEPSAPLAERSRKHSPLKDVAGMLRSFDYAARPTLDELPDPTPAAEACAYWTSWVSGAFVDAYLATGGAVLLPEGREASEAILRDFLLEKAAYEVLYELDNRPSWVGIPLRGILDQLSARFSPSA